MPAVARAGLVGTVGLLSSVAEVCTSPMSRLSSRSLPVAGAPDIDNRPSNQ